MSIIAIRAAIESAINSIAPPIATAWENIAFAPVTGTPYQRVWLPGLPAENPTMGGGHQRINSYAQVDLMYPPNTGTAAIGARAELIKAKFHRGASFISGGITVIVETDPEVGGGSVDSDRYKVVVRFRYWADIFR